MDRKAAEAEIKSVFSNYKIVTASDDKTLKSMTNGKVYELFVLAEIIERLDSNGYQMNFVGSNIKFKGSPGLLKQSDPHFDIFENGSLAYQLFVSVEFKTFRPNPMTVADDSCYHEIDVGVFAPGLDNVRPKYHEVLLVVECKSGGNFSKDIVRGILGLRRSLSLLQPSKTSLLFKKNVPADPPSEVMLAAVNSKVLNYVAGPEGFGIDLEHLEP